MSVTKLYDLTEWVVRDSHDFRVAGYEFSHVGKEAAEKHAKRTKGGATVQLETNPVYRVNAALPPLETYEVPPEERAH